MRSIAVFMLVLALCATSRAADTLEYRDACAGFSKVRSGLLTRYQMPDANIDSFHAQVRMQLEISFLHLCHFWIGTDWDFNGISSVPGQGKIACGHFVANILSDLGFNFNRRKLGRQAASRIIYAFVKDSSLIRRYANIDSKKLETELRKMGAGVYLIGLDYHVGFLAFENDSIYFIHSSFYEPQKVVWQGIHEHSPIKDSEVIMIGKLFQDKKILKAWIRHEKIF